MPFTPIANTFVHKTARYVFGYPANASIVVEYGVFRVTFNDPKLPGVSSTNLAILQRFKEATVDVEANLLYKDFARRDKKDIYALTLPYSNRCLVSVKKETLGRLDVVRLDHNRMLVEHGNERYAPVRYKRTLCVGKLNDKDALVEVLMPELNEFVPFDAESMQWEMC